MQQSRAELKKVLGPLEADVMTAVWALARPVSVREMLGHLNGPRAQPLAYTTVMTVMARLAEKGVLNRELQGRSYVYEAAARDPAAIAVRGVLRDFGDAAIANFADEMRADPKLRRRLQRLLADER